MDWVSGDKRWAFYPSDVLQAPPHHKNLPPSPENIFSEARKNIIYPRQCGSSLDHIALIGLLGEQKVTTWRGFNNWGRLTTEVFLRETKSSEVKYGPADNYKPCSIHVGLPAFRFLELISEITRSHLHSKWILACFGLHNLLRFP